MVGLVQVSVRFMTVNEVIECGRVERMKNGTDVESTDSEVCQARIRCQQKG